jgi:hypothetical protein
MLFNLDEELIDSYKKKIRKRSINDKNASIINNNYSDISGFNEDEEEEDSNNNQYIPFQSVNYYVFPPPIISPHSFSQIEDNDNINLPGNLLSILSLQETISNVMSNPSFCVNMSKTLFVVLFI